MFKQATFAFLFDIAGLVAGFLIAYQLNIFQHYSWAFALYPTLISTRIINGLLSGRLGTGLHLGTINPQFSKNTNSFRKIIHAVIVLTLVTSVAVSAISMVLGNLFLGIQVSNFPAILSVMVATLAIGLIFSLVTMKVAFFSFKHGLDPDIVVYPIIATLASIFITLCYVGVLNLWALGPLADSLILAIVLVHLALAVFLISTDRRDFEFKKTIKESLLMLLLVAFIVTVTGIIFGHLTRFTRSEIDVIFPALLTAYPALINNISNVGSVVGSTANTKLALGLLRPSFSSIKNHAKNIASAWLASFLIFVVLALAALLISGNYSASSIVDVIAIILVSNLLAVTGIVTVSYGIAILTFRRGLNPENFVIPLETSFATAITSIALLIALLLLTLH